MTAIDRDSLHTYLNDHLAGSVAALDLMGRIANAHAGTPLGNTLARLQGEVAGEQEILRTLVQEVGGTESAAARAVAWAGEKISRLKIGTGGHDDSGLKLFEALEALTLGFAGRGALWRTLDRVRQESPLPATIDFAALARQAAAQLDELEAVRLEAGVAALTTPVMAAPGMTVASEPEANPAPAGSPGMAP